MDPGDLTCYLMMMKPNINLEKLNILVMCDFQVIWHNITYVSLSRSWKSQWREYQNFCKDCSVRVFLWLFVMLQTMKDIGNLKGGGECVSKVKHKIISPYMALNSLRKPAVKNTTDYMEAAESFTISLKTLRVLSKFKLSTTTIAQKG